MNRLTWAALAGALAPQSLPAQATSPPPAPARAAAPGTAGDSATIAGLELAAEAAVVRGDTAVLARIYAPDFKFTHSSGQVQDRAMLLAQFGRPAPPGAPARARTVDSLQVEIHGDVALSTGRIHGVVGPTPRLPSGREYTIRYARVWARRHGRWQLLTHHSTAYALGPPVSTTPP